MDNELYEKKGPRKWQHMSPEEKQQELEMLLKSNDSNLFSLILMQHKLKQII